MESFHEAGHHSGNFDDIKTLIESKHVDLKSELAKGQALQEKIQDMTAQMDDLNTTITSEIRPALSDSTEQLQRATAELAETTELLQLVEQLLQLGRQLAASRRLQQAGQLAEAADCVSELRQQTQRLEDRTGHQVSLLSDLRDQALVQEEAVLHALVCRWRAAFSWDDSDAVLTVRPAGLEDTAAGLRRLGRLGRHLERLSEAVLGRLAAPLVAGGRLQRRRDADSLTLSVSAAEPGPEPEPGAVYAALTELVTALAEAALTGPLLAEFGALAGPALAQRLVDGPLAAAIPSGPQQRAAFDTVIESTERFSAALAELGFWDRSDSLLAYVSDVDRLMVDRVCADRLAAGRRLLAAPLHVTVPVGGGPPAADGPEPPDGALTDCLYRLPRCRVSESAVQYAELVETTVSEAAGGAPLLAARLHYTTGRLLELYCALLPELHRHHLASVPEQAAIAHNNLQLLAHRVTALAVRHRCADGTFLDMVPELRRTGSDIFLAALTHQKEQLLDILSEAGLENLAQTGDLSATAGAALRRCGHQLRRVCRVWRPVLPAGVHARAAGLLLSVVTGWITERVLAQQDISASAASQLTAAAGPLVDDALALFRPDTEGEEDPTEGGAPAVSESEARALLSRHTAGWGRFTELLLVLEETMRGILDRWSDGKGPLAQHFSAEQARHLVRALFQNNERRAATLARIK
ncbi:centromere/kinetochore protein zw10 homolog [Amphibalanus amphitrite]|uniref:centromere/kinetochore protein zw10 homolog n=1 Tax=Amphibalanus amphitrite TaxID=1232801 RepID=UPI001C90F4E7|nr:centromere/kinetochore protein zw10 homolog [Amphibalanus amphitrite]